MNREATDPHPGVDAFFARGEHTTSVAAFRGSAVLDDGQRVENGAVADNPGANPDGWCDPFIASAKNSVSHDEPADRSSVVDVFAGVGGGRSAVVGDAVGLCRAIAADPGAARVVAVRGPGGYGKSILLARIAREYAAAGVEVRETVDLGEPERSTVVLVDDAHRLDSSALAQLSKLARTPGARLVLTYRPYPRSVDLTRLLNEADTAVSLPGWGADELAEHAGREIVGPVGADWVRWLVAESGGVPRFAARVLAVTAGGCTERYELPVRALDQFHHDMDQLDHVARDCLVALVLGASSRSDELVELLDVDGTAVRAALAAVRASGLIGTDDAPPPIVRRAVSRLTPYEVWRRFARGLVAARLRHGRGLLPVLRLLLPESAEADVGAVPDETLSRGFELAGDEALAAGAVILARRLFDAAVTTGATPARVDARRAHTAALLGEFDTALGHADRALVDAEAVGRDGAARVAALSLAHRGLLARCAELCAWSTHRARWTGDTAFAALSMLGTGRVDRARELVSQPDDTGPPTAEAGFPAQLAHGVWESVFGAASTAVSTVTRAAALAESTAEPLVPDTAAALAALVALHSGELDVARSVLERAGAASVTGAADPHGTRHRLLAAFLPLTGGATGTVCGELDIIERTELRGRDKLLATALRAGAASRDNDTRGLSAVRGRIRQAVAEHPVDLFALLPLGELALAAARLGDDEWIAPYRQQGLDLLSRLHQPPLWSAPLRWKLLQAAIVVRDRDSAAAHVAALHEAAGHNPLATALADAGQVWLTALSGNVDAERAKRAAGDLHAAGFAWDGARLAGQVALHTTDRRSMLGLLETARTLQGKPSRPRAVPADPAVDAAALSQREREVAELVLAGRTYKEVGERLFISAKTVEHHIGRMKQRLGCGGRQELLARLRELLS